MIRRLEDSKLTFSHVAAQWDRLAHQRAEHHKQGIDLSSERFIIPHVLELMAGHEAAAVLDAGCGLGQVSRNLADLGYDVVGVDLSAASLQLARDLAGEHIAFHVTSVEAFASTSPRAFDVVVANMSLTTTPDLDGFLRAARQLCREDRATLIASIPHPAFWPRYWQYEADPEFRYDRELVVELPFKISRAETSVATTHIHRPIQRYIQALTAAGFTKVSVTEPMPGESLMKEYPKAWEFPRFMFFRADS